jgi:uncharacterized membrane protein
MNPFDFKSAILAKHAQHVALVHFPIALIFLGVVFDVLAVRRKSVGLFNAAYYTVIAAAISVVPTIVTGLLAWQLQLEGIALRGNLRLHLMLTLFSSVMIWLVCWLHFNVQRKPQPGMPRLRLAVEFATVFLTLFAGHVGGFLSGVNGSV